MTSSEPDTARSTSMEPPVTEPDVPATPSPEPMPAAAVAAVTAVV